MLQSIEAQRVRHNWATEQPQEYFYGQDFKAVAINGWDKIESKPLFTNINLKPEVSLYQVPGTRWVLRWGQHPDALLRPGFLPDVKSITQPSSTYTVGSFIHSFPYCLSFLKYFHDEFWGGRFPFVVLGEWSRGSGVEHSDLGRSRQN